MDLAEEFRSNCRIQSFSESRKYLWATYLATYMGGPFSNIDRTQSSQRLGLQLGEEWTLAEERGRTFGQR